MTLENVKMLEFLLEFQGLSAKGFLSAFLPFKFNKFGGSSYFKKVYITNDERTRQYQRVSTVKSGEEEKYQR